MAVPPKANSLAHRHIKNALSAKREKPHIYAAIRVVAPETLHPPSLLNRPPGLPKLQIALHKCIQRPPERSTEQLRCCRYILVQRHRSDVCQRGLRGGTWGGQRPLKVKREVRQG